MIGLVIFDGKDVRLEQYFAETPAEEKEIISLTNKALKDVDYVITYNGKLFDMPFLKNALKSTISTSNPYAIWTYLWL